MVLLVQVSLPTQTGKNIALPGVPTPGTWATGNQYPVLPPSPQLATLHTPFLALIVVLLALPPHLPFAKTPCPLLDRMAKVLLILWPILADLLLLHNAIMKFLGRPHDFPLSLPLGFRFGLLLNLLLDPPLNPCVRLLLDLSFDPPYDPFPNLVADLQTRADLEVNPLLGPQHVSLPHWLLGSHPAQPQLRNNAAGHPGGGDISDHGNDPDVIEHGHDGPDEPRRVALVGAVKPLDRHKPTLAMFPPNIQAIMRRMAPRAKSKIIAYGTYDYFPSDGGHEVPSREDIVTAAWESACKELKRNEPYDPVYGKWIDGLITTFRNQSKKAIKPILDDHYKFTEGDPDGNAEKVNHLLLNGFHQGLPEEDRRPFESPFLIKACREVVFVGSDAWALKYPKLFEPFRPCFIAFVCAVTNHIIEAYRGGLYNPNDQLNVRTQTQAFRKYLALLTDMERTRRNAFFRLFRDMYAECCSQVNRNPPKSPSPPPPHQWSPDIEENEFSRAGFPPSDDEPKQEQSDEDMDRDGGRNEARLDDANVEIDQAEGGDESGMVCRVRSRGEPEAALVGLHDDENYEGESDDLEAACEASKGLCPSDEEMEEYEGEGEQEFYNDEIAVD
ncbi:hypothetical protein FRC06_009808 [Ceratobasidium sp. 370]|nr:hypothetical protein FRC06_009808 [Ceratobasidium sp. 370]